MRYYLTLVICFLALASCSPKAATSSGGGAWTDAGSTADALDVADVAHGPGDVAVDVSTIADIDKLDSSDAPTDAVPVDVCQDADQDGHPALACGGDDCDDTQTAIHPGAAEVCDGKDNNCNGKTDDVSAAQLKADGYCGSCALQCSPLACVNGACVAKTCTDECSPGDKKCTDGCSVVACVSSADPTGCNTWGTSETTCPKGTGCNLGLCGPGGKCGLPKGPCMSDDIGQFAGQFACDSTSFTDQQPLQFCDGGYVSCGGGSGCPVLFNHGYSAGCSNGKCNCEKIQ